MGRRFHGPPTSVSGYDPPSDTVQMLRMVQRSQTLALLETQQKQIEVHFPLNLSSLLVSLHLKGDPSVHLLTLYPMTCLNRELER